MFNCGWSGEVGEGVTDMAPPLFFLLKGHQHLSSGGSESL